jgi:hypothetical protein
MATAEVPGHLKAAEPLGSESRQRLGLLIGRVAARRAGPFVTLDYVTGLLFEGKQRRPSVLAPAKI